MRLAKFIIQTLMPLWMVVCGAAAYFFPARFVALAPHTPQFLGVVILCMGLTLSPEKLRAVFHKPVPFAAGFFGKWLWTVLPGALIAWLALKSYPLLAAGTILAGSTPSGASSNLFTFLSGGTVALSVSLTIVNTLLAPILTPLFTEMFAHRYVPVNFWALFVSTSQVVLIPIVLGVLLRLGFKGLVSRLEPGLPLISAFFLYMVALGTVAGAQKAMAANLRVLPLLAGVVLFQIFVSLILGYLTAYFVGCDVADRRAIMFETGIYNAGLGTVLTMGAFGAFAAISPLMNTVLNMTVGAILASVLTTMDERRRARTVAPTAAFPSAGS